MRGLTKKKRKYCRVNQATQNQKNIDFDYSNFNSHAQQAHAAIASAKTRSPVLKVKKDCAQLTAQLKKSSRSILQLEGEVKKHHNLKASNKE